MTVTVEVINNLVERLVEKSIECDRSDSLLKKQQDALDKFYNEELARSRTPATPEGRPLVEESVVCELLEAMNKGQKITAIKLYRELTGAGLKEAKDAIENHWVIFAEMK